MIRVVKINEQIRIIKTCSFPGGRTQEITMDLDKKEVKTLYTALGINLKEK